MISGLFQPWKRSVCSTFSWSGWNGVRNSSLAKGDTSKKRPSPHLHEVPIRHNNKASPRTLQTALVYIYIYMLKYFFLSLCCVADLYAYIRPATPCRNFISAVSWFFLKIHVSLSYMAVGTATDLYILLLYKSTYSTFNLFGLPHHVLPGKTRTLDRNFQVSY
jgi:hypothetical protein